MKRSLLFLLILPAVFLFTGCRPASANKLYRRAKAEHGACSLVSKTEDEKGARIVVHDKLQDFDYTVSSGMQDIMIDGSSFGSVPQTSDDFVRSLKKTVISNAGDAIGAACTGGVAVPEKMLFADDEILLIITAPDGKSAQDAALKCAAALQEQNKNERLNGMIITAYGNTDEDWWHCDHYGSVKLPDIVWRTPDDEHAAYYTEMARMQTDSKAEYLRTEYGKFSDTGADLGRVVSVLGTDYPTSPDSPVTFYYFRSAGGKEYYLCNFNYYDANHNDFRWFTNYTPDS